MSSVHGLSIPTVLSAEERASIYNNINYSSPLFWVEKKNCIRNKSCQGKPKKKTLPPLPLPPRSRSGSDTDTESNEITIRLLAHYNLELSEPKKAVCYNDEIMRQSFVNFMILCSPCSAVTIFSSVNLSSSLDCEDPFLFFYFPHF